MLAPLLAGVGEGKEEIMTAADQLVERGRQEGLEQGREQGREQARREMLLNMLSWKFGELPDAVIARVAAGSMADLYAWSMSVLTAPGLDDVFAGH